MKVNQVGDFSAILGVGSRPAHLLAVELALLIYTCALLIRRLQKGSGSLALETLHNKVN